MTRLALLRDALGDRVLRFAIRKHLELAASRSRSFSQFGEDLVVAKIFESIDLDPCRACFVDVGAFHPSWISNTFLFYRRGMTGLNVDLSADKIRLFEAFRPRDRSLVAAVVPDGGPAEVTVAIPPGPAETAAVVDGNPDPTALDPRFARGAVRHRTVRALAISELLDRVPRDRRLAYLNIDCEGLDEAIVRSMPFDDHRPAVLSVESAPPIPGRLDHLRSSPLLRHLEERGYTFVGQSGLTSIHVDGALVADHRRPWV